MAIEKGATVTISQEMFADLLRYFSYYPNNYYKLLDYNDNWTATQIQIAAEYCNIKNVVYHEQERPTVEEMKQLNDKIQRHLAEKVTRAVNREVYRQRKFNSGEWQKKKPPNKRSGEKKKEFCEDKQILTIKKL